MGHVQSGGDIGNCQYSAPEIRWPEEDDMDEIIVTKESDVYGMTMVVYEASSHHPASCGPRVTSHADLLGLDGDTPYSECNDRTALAKIQDGEIPQRPPSGIADSIWELLEECWNRVPIIRPPIAQVLNALLYPPTLPQVTPTPEGRPAVGELPGKLKLQVRSIKISLNKSKRQKYSVKFKYGNRDYMTSPTTKAMTGDEYTWFAFRPFLPLLPPLIFEQECFGDLVNRNE